MGPIRRHVIALTAVMGLAAPAIAAPASLAAESADHAVRGRTVRR